MKNKHLECQLLVGFCTMLGISLLDTLNPFSRRCLKKWAVLVNQQQKLGRDMSVDTVEEILHETMAEYGIFTINLPYQLVQVGSANGLLPILPRKLTWNLKMDPWKRRFLLETILFRFHVSFRGCIYNISSINSRFLENHHRTSDPPVVRKHLAESAKDELTRFPKMFFSCFSRVLDAS